MTPRRLLFYTLGQFGIMVLTRYLYQWVLKFSDSPAEGTTLFAAAAVGAVMFGFRAFDGVTDPIAGAVSDWWVGQGRKRQNLLLFSFFLAPVGLAVTFTPDDAMPPVFRWAVFVIGLFVFFVGYTLYAIPYWTLVDDYSRQREGDRRALSNLLGLGLILATIVGFVLTPLLIDLLGYRGGAVVLAVVAAGCMLGPIFAAPEATDRPASRHSALGLREVVRAFGGTFRNRRFVAVLALLAGSQMSFTILTAAAPYVAEDLLGGSEKDVSLLLGPLIVSAVPMFAFAPRVSRHLGWQRALMLTSVLLGVVYIGCSFLGGTLIHSPMVTAMVVFALAGPMIAMLLALDAEAIAACVPEADRGKVSLYFGVYNLVVKTLNGVALFLTAMLISLSGVGLGNAAVRLTVITAGLLLFVGVVAGWAISRSGVNRTASAVDDGGVASERLPPDA